VGVPELVAELRRVLLEELLVLVAEERLGEVPVALDEDAAERRRVPAQEPVVVEVQQVPGVLQGEVPACRERPSCRSGCRSRGDS
jgi:hypothetical protein